LPAQYGPEFAARKGQNRSSFGQVGLGLEGGKGAIMARVLIPIPDRDFDPTEVAITWRVLRERGHAITFATETGAVGRADDIMVTGRGLDLWSGLPVLNRVALIGSLLGANADARAAYAAMLEDSKFRAPKTWSRV
jgi:hypothetical protein